MAVQIAQGSSQNASYLSHRPAPPQPQLDVVPALDLAEALKEIRLSDAKFCSPNRFLAELDKSEQSGAFEVKFTHVPAHELARLESAIEAKGRRLKASIWDSESQILIVSIPTLAHERLHRELDDWLLLRAARMGVNDGWRSVGNADYFHLDHQGRVLSRSEGDSGRIPVATRPSRHGFPTIMIEAAYSESWAHSRIKAKWWLTASKYTVRIVIIAKVTPSIRGDIILEIWKGVPSFAITTRSQTYPALQPECVQTISITLTPGGDGSQAGSYAVARGPLVLPFRELFDRAPQVGEEDFELTDSDLRRCAVAIFDARWT